MERNPIGRDNYAEVDRWSQVSPLIGRSQVEQLAEELGRQSLDNVWRVARGLLALPAACAMGLASTALYSVALVERSFVLFQISAERARHEGAMFYADHEVVRGRRDGASPEAPRA